MSAVRLEVFSDVVCPWCYLRNVADQLLQAHFTQVGVARSCRGRSAGYHRRADLVANRSIGAQGAQPSETLLEFLRQAADQPVSA
ncbi:hypothetical protein [Jatrophihabitans lederbergiae]|uniref:DSBA-like thioredoxin domain-containing protein n=1 Tax=Jatrophihabitans lederbergiae TaxID=3075547 RepID=A0ABU2J7T5_9ACTN|nr:hypothetical protein [Jatrophihabitans sp. DSM 44399]MDT0260811.1 hypothetical protein [Jatrophihabitans sp. DSM 44399]